MIVELRSKFISSAHCLATVDLKKLYVDTIDNQCDEFINVVNILLTPVVSLDHNGDHFRLSENNVLSKTHTTADWS